MSVIVCQPGCTQELPPVSFSDCNPEINLSQITKLYVTQPGNPLNSWSDGNEWAARLSNSSNDTNSIRSLTVIGSKPRPEVTTVSISANRTVTTDKKHTVNFAIDESNDDVHEFVREGQCVKKVLFWYETLSGHIFGGTAGIEGSYSVEMELGEGAGDITKYTGNLVWQTIQTEERIDKPF